MYVGYMNSFFITITTGVVKGLSIKFYSARRIMIKGHMCLTTLQRRAVAEGNFGVKGLLKEYTSSRAPVYHY